MRTFSRLIGLLTLFSVVLSLFAPLETRAEVLYQSYTKDNFGNIIPVQPPYQPVAFIGRQLFVTDPDQPEKLVPSPLNNPSDIFIDKNDRIYIADTGNNRIVVFHPDGSLSRIITLEDSPLRRPEGVFVTDDTFDIYIADTGNRRVVKLDQEGNLLQVIESPQSSFIPEDYTFYPIKLVVDNRGFMFIATLGGYQGLIQLDPNGEFVSFFGANTTEISSLNRLMSSIKNLLYTQEMKENQSDQLPATINNVAINDRGFIYTVSSGGNITSRQIKKFNFSGKNLLSQSDDYVVTNSWTDFGMSQASRTFGEVTDRQLVPDKSVMLVDVAIDTYNNFATIDRNYQNVSFYDEDGNLLFFWANQGSSFTTQLGLQRAPIALAYNSRNELFILDNQDNLLTKYELTTFGRKVLEANDLTSKGLYEESSALWREILQFNSEYPPAINGLARVAYQQGNFEEARELFFRGQNQYEYSNSFWQMRLEWFRYHFGTFAYSLLFIGIGYLVVNRIFKIPSVRQKWNNRQKLQHPLIKHLKYAFYVLRHPIEGFSAIRMERKGGVTAAIILLLIALGSIIFSQYYTSFSFNNVDKQSIQLLPTILQFCTIWFGWVVCHYFIGSIMQGEARFKHVFIGSAYSLMPIVLFMIPLALLSNVFTLSELSIYQFLNYGIIIWVGLLFFWNVQTMQNYYFGETVVNILVTLFAMVMVGVIVFLIYSLSNQLLQFIVSIYRELVLR